MARNRMFKPSFCTSRQVTDCCHSARLLFMLMWAFCDDQGVHTSDAKTLKMEVFPGDDILVKDVEGWVNDLIGVGLLVEFENDGQLYLQVTGWHHQVIDKPHYRFPSPKDGGSKIVRGALGDKSTQPRKHSATGSRTVVDRSDTDSQPLDNRSTQERKGKERKGKGEKTVDTFKSVDRASNSRKKPVPPERSAVAADLEGAIGACPPFDSSNPPPEKNGEGRSIQELSKLRIELLSKKLTRDPNDPEQPHV